MQAKLPPTFDFGRDFIPFHVPTTFPKSEIGSYPLVSLPRGISGDPAHWHAILFSGESNLRHVNDMEFLYRILVNYYGVPVQNITVLNLDGTLSYEDDKRWVVVDARDSNWPGDDTPYQMAVNGQGTKQALLNAIAAVGQKLTSNGNLLLHTNNHGWKSKDGTRTTLISRDRDDVLPDDLARALKDLREFRSLMVMMEQCYSGAFILPIVQASTAECTSVATAVDADSPSWGGEYFDAFALEWISAMAESEPDGSELKFPLKVGLDGVSAAEAFRYAKDNNTSRFDNPQYGENEPCGGMTTLRQNRRFVRVPSELRHLWPWKMLPDPNSEEIGRISVQVGRKLQSRSFREKLMAAISQGRDRIHDVVRRAIGRLVT